MLHEFSMRSGFSNTAFIQYQNIVGIDNRIKAVSYNQHYFIFH